MYGEQIGCLGKLGEEYIAVEHRKPKWDPVKTQALLKHTHPLLQACSGSAQVKAAAAHVQRLKRNQRRKKSSMTIVEFDLILLEPFGGGHSGLIGTGYEEYLVMLTANI